MQQYEVTLEVTALVTIHDDDVIDRVLENRDDWRSYAYNYSTRAEVLQHLAYECIMNGCDNLNGLDGWADIPEGADMRVVGVEYADIQEHDANTGAWKRLTFQ